MVFALGWNLVTAVGLVVGPSVPAGWRLDFAPAVMFAGLTIVAVNRRPAAVAALVGGAAGLLAVGLRDRLGILVGAIAGVVAGAIADE
jgi:predicted branched-subunit amino acid permease